MSWLRSVLLWDLMFISGQVFNVSRKKFSEGQSLLFPEELKQTKQSVVSYEPTEPEKKYICPLCLSVTPIHRMLLYRKDGSVKSNVCCPECKQNMQRSSLMIELDPVVYAKWLYLYKRADWKFNRGADERIKWDMIKKRLYATGFADAFWTEWKRVKAEYVIPRPMTDEELDKAASQYQKDEDARAAGKL